MRSAKSQPDLFAESADAGGQQFHAVRPLTGDIAGTAQPKPEKLWLCVYFPSLCLAAAGAMSRAAVVTDNRRSQPLVVAANAAAAAAGIAPGLTANAALALFPALEIRPRDEAAEWQLINELAQSALAFTPVVSVVPAGLLLEVRGSLHLFGGLRSLSARLTDEFRRRVGTVRIAYAPAARAACWAARAGPDRPHGCMTRHGLHALLAGLPLHCPDWPVAVQVRLRKMGIVNLGDCLRLPRDGFARRIGPQYLLELDQALGRHPDVRDAIQPPVRFRARLELGTETIDIQPVIGLCRQLLTQLSDFMRRRQCGVPGLRVRLLHYRHPPTIFDVRLREAERNSDYLFDLLCLRFDRLKLQHPVTGVYLSAETVSIDERTGPDLFTAGVAQEHARAGQYLLERLRTRLGAGRVGFIHEVAEHRPEHAWCPSPVPVVADCPGERVYRQRPTWLLAQPERLRTTRNQPIWGGPLTFLSGAERIETGWWDGADIRRDYYAVAGATGARGWIFRDCRHSAWYLHGIFA